MTPPKHQIQLSGRLYAEILDITPISAKQFRFLVGGVMTPPYNVTLEVSYDLLRFWAGYHSGARSGGH